MSIFLNRAAIRILKKHGVYTEIIKDCPKRKDEWGASFGTLRKIGERYLHNIVFKV